MDQLHYLRTHYFDSELIINLRYNHQKWLVKLEEQQLHEQNDEGSARAEKHPASNAAAAATETIKAATNNDPRIGGISPHAIEQATTAFASPQNSKKIGKAVCQGNSSKIGAEEKLVPSSNRQSAQKRQQQSNARKDSVSDETGKSKRSSPRVPPPPSRTPAVDEDGNATGHVRVRTRLVILRFTTINK